MGILLDVKNANLPVHNSVYLENDTT